jgi:hypothetical protein
MMRRLFLVLRWSVAAVLLITLNFFFSKFVFDDNFVNNKLESDRNFDKYIDEVENFHHMEQTTDEIQKPKSTNLKMNSFISKQKPFLPLPSFPPQSSNSTINILFYTSFWDNKFWLRNSEHEIQNPPEMKHCSVKNCRFTREKQTLPSIVEFDALIFHHAHGWLVDAEYWKTPEARASKQFYIFAADEYEKSF